MDIKDKLDVGSSETGEDVRPDDEVLPTDGPLALAPVPGGDAALVTREQRRSRRKRDIRARTISVARMRSVSSRSRRSLEYA